MFLSERVRSRVEDVGRVELTDAEAVAFVRTKVVHLVFFGDRGDGGGSERPTVRNTRHSYCGVALLGFSWRQHHAIVQARHHGGRGWHPYRKERGIVLSQPLRDRVCRLSFHSLVLMRRCVID